MFSRFVHTAACIGNSYLLIAEEFLLREDTMFVHLSGSKHLGCVYLSVFMNNAVIGTFGYKSLYEH